MNTKNQTNLIVIGKYERLKKKKRKRKRKREKEKKKGKKKNFSGAVCLPERLIVHISTTYTYFNTYLNTTTGLELGTLVF